MFKIRNTLNEIPLKRIQVKLNLEEIVWKQFKLLNLFQLKVSDFFCVKRQFWREMSLLNGVANLIRNVFQNVQLFGSFKIFNRARAYKMYRMLKGLVVSFHHWQGIYHSTWSYTNLQYRSYAEIKHYNWLKLVTWLPTSTTNENALLQWSIAKLLYFEICLLHRLQTMPILGSR